MTDPSFARTRQCAKCPWKKSTDPREIPNGYDPDKHRALVACQSAGLGVLRAMACHESPVGAEQACVGWTLNQLGPGNNIALRLMAARGRIPRGLETDGEQHESVEAMCAAAPRTKRRHR